MTSQVNDILISANYIVDQRRLEENRRWVESTAKDAIVQQVARHIASKYIEQHNEGYNVEFRLDVCAASPKEFYKLIRDEANTRP